jgi:hypothetical protein
VDWRDEQQVRHRVSEWAAGEHDGLQLTEYIESRALKWIKELGQIADIALSPHGDRGPDYDLAARILLSLIKLSSVNRQRVDLTAQIAMSSGPDLSGLSDTELRAIELADDETLNELALRIGPGQVHKAELASGVIGHGRRPGRVTGDSAMERSGLRRDRLQNRV